MDRGRLIRPSQGSSAAAVICRSFSARLGETVPDENGVRLWTEEGGDESGGRGLRALCQGDRTDNGLVRIGGKGIDHAHLLVDERIARIYDAERRFAPRYVH